MLGKNVDNSSPVVVHVEWFAMFLFASSSKACVL